MRMEEEVLEVNTAVQTKFLSFKEMMTRILNIRLKSTLKAMKAYRMGMEKMTVKKMKRMISMTTAFSSDRISFYRKRIN